VKVGGSCFILSVRKPLPKRRTPSSRRGTAALPMYVALLYCLSGVVSFKEGKKAANQWAPPWSYYTGFTRAAICSQAATLCTRAKAPFILTANAISV